MYSTLKYTRQLNGFIIYAYLWIYSVILLLCQWKISPFLFWFYLLLFNLILLEKWRCYGIFSDGRIDLRGKWTEHLKIISWCYLWLSIVWVVYFAEIWISDFVFDQWIFSSVDCFKFSGQITLSVIFTYILYRVTSFSYPGVCKIWVASAICYNHSYEGDFKGWFGLLRSAPLDLNSLLFGQKMQHSHLRLCRSLLHLQSCPFWVFSAYERDHMSRKSNLRRHLAAMCGRR